MQTRVTGLESGSANFSAPHHGEATPPPRFTHLVNGAIKYLAEHLRWALTDMPAGKACAGFRVVRMLYPRHPRVSAVHLLCAIRNKVCLVRIQKRTTGCGRELPVRWLSCALLECDQQQPASWHGNVPRALPGSVLKIGSPEVRRLRDPYRQRGPLALRPKRAARQLCA